MKTKLIILFFAVTIGALVLFLNQEKNLLEVNIENQSNMEEGSKPVNEQAVEPQKIIESQSATTTKPAKIETEEKIKAVMLINGSKYETEIKAGSSVYDLMNLLKSQNKINFSGKNYSGLGFFVEEINSLKNNPAGKNWLYYVNGKPAQVGISYYLIKANDIIEWKYEKKSF